MTEVEFLRQQLAKTEGELRTIKHIVGRWLDRTYPDPSPPPLHIRQVIDAALAYCTAKYPGDQDG